MVLSVVTYGCESWTVKKAERRRIDAFELWCWRRLLRVPWIARTSNQSILTEISPGFSLEGMMLKLKLWYFGHIFWCEELTHLKRSWWWERLKAGGEAGNRGWDGWMASPTQWTWVCVDSRSWWRTGRPGMLWFMGSQRVRHGWVTELNWTEFILGYVEGGKAFHLPNKPLLTSQFSWNSFSSSSSWKMLKKWKFSCDSNKLLASKWSYPLPNHKSTN